jgi:hypothetical protein
MAVAAKGPWDLPIRGYEVLLITFGFPIGIVVYRDVDISATISLAGAFSVTELGHRVSLDA